MKKNGFTLVELMAVIAIVGILASIAIPQFMNANARARAAEVPLNLNKIKSAQEAYRAEARVYLGGATWGVDASGNSLGGTVGNTPGRNLGIKIDQSAHFNYSTDVRNGGRGYIANANLIGNVGKAKATDNLTVTLDQDGNSKVTASKAESVNAMKLYLKNFITPANP